MKSTLLGALFMLALALQSCGQPSLSNAIQRRNVGVTSANSNTILAPAAEAGAIASILPSAKGGMVTFNPSLGNAATGFQCNQRQSGQSGVPVRIKRLTAIEYVNSVTDLLHSKDIISKNDLQSDTVSLSFGFNTFSETLGLSGGDVQVYRSAAAKIADYVKTNALLLAVCDAGTKDQSCAEKYLINLAQRAWRKPLQSAESDALKAIASKAFPAVGFSDALFYGAKYIFLSPLFLFRTELGNEGGNGKTIKLTQHEIVTLISYALLRTTPSNSLLELANQGKIQSGEDVAALVRSIVASGAAERSPLTADFVEQWLDIGDDNGVAKDAVVYPKFNKNMYSLMRKELELFTVKRIWGGDGSLQKLLSDRSFPLNTTLASYYGLPSPNSSEFKEVDTSVVQPQRAGVFSMGAFTASGKHSRTSDSFVQGRGKSIATRLLCFEIGAPPPGALDAINEPVGTRTHRQYLGRVMASKGCQFCHLKMDPPGLALESFDGAGVFRKQWSNSEAVDASGTYSGTDLVSPFNDFGNLADLFSKSSQVSRCFTIQSYRYLFGAMNGAEDDCAISDVYEKSKQNQFHVGKLWEDFLSTDSAIYRKSIDK